MRALQGTFRGGITVLFRFCQYFCHFAFVKFFTEITWLFTFTVCIFARFFGGVGRLHETGYNVRLTCHFFWHCGRATYIERRTELHPQCVRDFLVCFRYLFFYKR